MGHFYWFVVQSARATRYLSAVKRDASPETSEERRRDARIYRSNLDVQLASLGPSSSIAALARCRVSLVPRPLPGKEPGNGASLASPPYFSGGRSERGKIRLGTLTSFPCHEGI